MSETIQTPPPAHKNGTNGHKEHLPGESTLIAEPTFPPRGQSWGKTLGISLLCAAVCGGAAFGVSKLLPPIYHSETTLYFPGSGDASADSIIGTLKGIGNLSAPTDSDGNVALLGGLVSSPQVGSGPNTSIAILDSDKCRDLVIKDCDLAKKWHQSRRSVLRQTLDGVVTFGVNKNGLLAIETVDKDPKLAEQITKSYTRNLRNIAVDMSASKARESREFVENQLAQARKEQIRDENRLVSIQDKNMRDNPLATGPAAAKIAEGYAALSLQQLQTQNDLAAANARLEKVTAIAKSALGENLNLPADSPYAQALTVKLREAQAQYSVDKATLGPDNPALLQHKAELDTANESVQQEITRSITALRKGISPDVAALYATQAGLKAESAGIAEALHQARVTLSTLPETQIIEARMTAEVRLDEAQVQTLQAAEVQARMAEQRAAASFEVVDAAETSDEPFAPRRKFLIAFCALAGLLLAIAWQVGRSIFPSSIPPAPRIPALSSGATTRETV